MLGNTAPPPNIAEIGSFWIGPSLGWMERICLASFVTAGHNVSLFSYTPIENVPDGITLRDAEEVLPRARLERLMQVGLYQMAADVFRYEMIASSRMVWVDADVLCIKPLPVQPYLLASMPNGLVHNCVMGVPEDCPAIADLRAFVGQEKIVFPKGWSIRNMDRVAGTPEQIAGGKAALAGDAQLPEHIPYASFGPHALAYFVGKHGLGDKLCPTEVIEPYHTRPLVQNFLRPNRFPLSPPEETLTIHLTGGRLRKRLADLGGTTIRPRSLLGRYARLSGIGLEMAP